MPKFFFSAKNGQILITVCHFFLLFVLSTSAYQKNCAADQKGLYYDFWKSDCSLLPLNTQLDSVTNLLYCQQNAILDPSFYPLNSANADFSSSLKKLSFLIGQKGCQLCEEGKAAAFAATRCLACERGNCQCDLETSVIIGSAPDGSPLDVLTCVKCAEGLKADWRSNTCFDPKAEENALKLAKKNCPSNETLLKGFCVANENINLAESIFPLASAQKIIYPISQNKELTIGKSDFVLDNYYLLAARCFGEKDISACGGILNLCVSLDFDQNPGFCSLYQKAVRQLNSQVPKSNTTANSTANFQQSSAVVQNWSAFPSSKKIPGETFFSASALNYTSLSNSTSKSDLSIIMASFDLNGTFLGLKKIDASIHFCASNFRAYVPGKNEKIQCAVSLKNLLAIEPKFFELYFEDGKGEIHPIPIALHNQGYSFDVASSANLTDLHLFYRFSLVENFMSANSTQGNSSGPQILRVFDKGQFVVLQNAQNEFALILHFSYQYISTNSTDFGSQIDFSLEIAHYFSSNVYFVAAVAIFVVLNISVVILAIVRFAIWLKITPSAPDSNNPGLINSGVFFFLLLKSYAAMTFAGLLLIAVVFIGLKYGAAGLAYPFPLVSAYPGFYSAALGFLVLCVLLGVAMVIETLVRFGRLEYLLIDWEKTRLEVELPSSLDIGLENKGTGKFELVSAWRSIFAANEFFELSVQRKIDVKILMLLTILFLDFAGFESAKFDFGNQSVRNVVLLFGVNSLIMLLLLALLFGLKALQGLLYGSELQNYMDFLSLTNVSLLVFDAKHHGFYLHGENNTGSSENSIDEFNAVLEKEAKGYFKSRGLLAEDKEELQCFEVFLPVDFQYFFNTTFKMELKAELSKSLGNYAASFQPSQFFASERPNENLGMAVHRRFQSPEQVLISPGLEGKTEYDLATEMALKMQAGQLQAMELFRKRQEAGQRMLLSPSKRLSKTPRTSIFGGSKNRGLPLTLNFNKLFEHKAMVEDLFKMMLANISANKDVCLERSCLHRFFGIPSFDIMALKSSPIFFKDKELFVSGCLYSGIERQIVWVNLLVFSLLDYLIGQPMIAAVVVWFLDFLRHQLMASIIQKNFARSSLISEAFLA